MSVRTHIFLLAPLATVLEKHRSKMMLIGRVILSNFMNIQSSFVVAKVMQFFELAFFQYHFFCENYTFFSADCRENFVPLCRKTTSLILKEWPLRPDEKWCRYSDVAESQCNMNTVLDGTETFSHRIQRGGVPLLCCVLKGRL